MRKFIFGLIFITLIFPLCGSAHRVFCYGPTVCSEHLWRIAMVVRGEYPVSLQQTMLAILRLNPNAFVEGNVNGLKAGYTLRLPSLSQIQFVSHDRAAQIIKQQNLAWEQPTLVAHGKTFHEISHHLASKKSSASVVRVKNVALTEDIKKELSEKPKHHGAKQITTKTTGSTSLSDLVKSEATTSENAQTSSETTTKTVSPSTSASGASAATSISLQTSIAAATTPTTPAVTPPAAITPPTTTPPAGITTIPPTTPVPTTTPVTTAPVIQSNGKGQVIAPNQLDRINAFIQDMSNFKESATSRLNNLEQQSQSLTDKLNKLEQEFSELTYNFIRAANKSSPNSWNVYFTQLQDAIKKYGVNFLIGLLVLAVLLYLFRLLRRSSTKARAEETSEAEPIKKAPREKDEYDFMGSQEGVPAKIDLARAYIDMGDYKNAKIALEEVIKQGNEEQKKTAQELLDSIKI